MEKPDIFTTMQAKEKHQLQPKPKQGGETEHDLKLDNGEQCSDPHNEEETFSWRNEADDYSLRRRVMVNMYKLLIAEFKKNDNFSIEWRRKLPLLVRHLESTHYQESPSREVYMDVCPRKMKKRLRSLAQDIYIQRT
jgi:hypothetical protein